MGKIQKMTGRREICQGTVELMSKYCRFRYIAAEEQVLSYHPGSDSVCVAVSFDTGWDRVL